MNTLSTKTKALALLFSFAALFSLPFIASAQFTDPTCSPPGCNSTPPVNVGSTAQEKTGQLTVDGGIIANLIANLVGIGTLSPQYPLDVTGNIHATGNIISGGQFCLPAGTNGGCISAWPSGGTGGSSGTVTSVGLSGGTTGLTVTSSTVNPITSNGTFTLAGTLAAANGGTGATSLGSGLSNTGSVLNVNTSTIQERVSGVCSSGTFMQSISSIGTVTCASASASGGTVTSITAGSGISTSPSPITGSGTISSTDTLDNVTGRGAITGNAVSVGQFLATGATQILGYNYYTFDNNNGLTFNDTQTGGWADNLIGAKGYNGTFLGGLGVLGNSSNNLSYLYVGTNYNSPWMTFLPSGNVGIGATKTNPQYPLDVAGAINGTSLCINGVCQTTWPSSGGSGTITGVTAGTDLTGGGTSGTVTLNVSPTAVAGALGACSGGQVLTGFTSGGAESCTTVSSGSGGTVTSVGLSGGTTGLTFSGSPITSSGTATLSGTLGVANGGTGATSLPTGILESANGSALAAVSVGLGLSYSAPFLNNADTLALMTGRSGGNTTGSSISLTGSASLSVGGNIATPLISASAYCFANGTNCISAWPSGGTGNSGTVTSVAATVPSFLSVSGSPITTSGTLAIGYSGTALPVANGGTGLTTLPSGILKSNGTTISLAQPGIDYAAPFILGFGLSNSSGTLNNTANLAFVTGNGATTASTITLTGSASLSVGGNIATPLISASAYCFANGTNCISAWPSGGTSQWTTSGSNIYYSTGNVGVGTASPSQEKLEVSGSSNSLATESDIGVDDTAGNTNSRNWSINNSGGTPFGALSFRAGTSAGAAPSVDAMEIDNDYGVGIGNGTAGSSTLPPANGLVVGGNVSLATNMSGAGYVGVNTTAEHDGTTWNLDVNGNSFLNGVTQTSAINSNLYKSGGGGTVGMNFVGSDLEIGGTNTFGLQVANVNFTNSGDVGIGNTSPQQKLDVTGNINTSGNITASGNLTATGSITAGASGFCLPGTNPTGGCITAWPTGGGSGSSLWTLKGSGPDIQYTAGNVYINGSGTAAGNVYAQAFYYLSDENLKKNIQTLSGALDNVMKLRGVSFNWKSSGAPSMGVIAQEVEQVYPDLVSTDPTTGIKSVNYAGLTGALIEAIKTQQTEIQTLQSEVDALKKP